MASVLVDAERLRVLLLESVTGELADGQSYETVWAATASCPHRPAWLEACPTATKLWIYLRSIPGAARREARRELIAKDIGAWFDHLREGCSGLARPSANPSVPAREVPYNILVSSPSDLKAFRAAVVEACKQVASRNDIAVQPILWEGGGADHPDIKPLAPYHEERSVQENISRQLRELGGVDVYVGMVWSQVGSPVDGFRSGTEAELRTAIEDRKKTGRPSAILFFHVTAPIPYRQANANVAAVEEFVRDLRKEILVVEVDSLTAFKGMLLDHLAGALRRSAAATGQTPIACPNCHSHDLVVRKEYVEEGGDEESGAYGSLADVIACSRCDWVGDQFG